MSAERFANLGLGYLTNLAQLVDQLNAFAATYEARGGADMFTAEKYVAGEGEQLTPEQEAHNARTDELSNDILGIIYLRNDLAAFLDAPKAATLARLRTDF